MSTGNIDRLGEFVAKRVNLDQTTKTYHLPEWKSKNDAARMRALREIAMKGGRDPDIATLAVNIVRDAGVQPRDYKGQAAALLNWVQSQIYYINEPGERLQDPVYTLKVRYGDCDDMAILLASLYEACRLPWRYVLSGRSPANKLVRWVEGTPKKQAKWSHIYVIVGYPPYTPKKWFYAEPTLQRVPLGWDVVGAAKANGGKVVLPELGSLTGEGSEQRVPLMVKKKDEKKPFTEHVKTEIVKGLHPRKVIPAIIVGLVMASMSGRFRAAVGAFVTGDKKKK
jgi:hypothetical protein